MVADKAGTVARTTTSVAEQVKDTVVERWPGQAEAAEARLEEEARQRREEEARRNRKWGIGPFKFG